MNLTPEAFSQVLREALRTKFGRPVTAAFLARELDLYTKGQLILSSEAGAGSLDDVSKLVGNLGVVGAAAGSLFVFKGKYRAVLINYPTPPQKTQLCRDALKS